MRAAGQAVANAEVLEALEAPLVGDDPDTMRDSVGAAIIYLANETRRLGFKDAARRLEDALAALDPEETEAKRA